MANRAHAVSQNVPGDYFVDTSCIDCDTCRQLAPTVFGDAGDYAYVKQQPTTAAELYLSALAALSCPTGSIGGAPKVDLEAFRGDFPLLLDEGVYYCGFTSPKSFGGSSYFLTRPDGNWLIDSPKYLEPLARRMEALGGIRYIFLTHRDDVADADKYARRFASERIIHQLELDSQPDAERVLEGFEPVMLAPGCLAIPTPGHTAGHCVLLVDDRFLFTGDHLWWEPEDGRLGMSQSYCWHSWPEQIESMRKLSAYTFEWVLPGHGQRVRLAKTQMKHEVERLLERVAPARRSDGG